VRFVGAPARFVVVGALLLLETRVPAFLSLGSEFMPPLNEGTLLYMPTAPPGIAIGEASRILQLMDRELREVPEVERVFGKIGPRRDADRSRAALDGRDDRAARAAREWRPGITWDALVAELDKKLRYPACRTSGGCRSRRAPRCSRPACAASSA
jgi:Cu(I)/Ag(I) efflux system membrane protein CusA/SilA